MPIHIENVQGLFGDSRARLTTTQATPFLGDREAPDDIRPGGVWSPGPGGVSNAIVQQRAPKFLCVTLYPFGKLGRSTSVTQGPHRFHQH